MSVPPQRRKFLPLLLGAAFVLALMGALVFEVIRTRPVRRAVRTYTELLTAANRQDLTAARRLCTTRYLRTHDLTAAPEGGLVGLPRNIHKNFRAWRQGEEIWLCPTNRIGPVYRFTRADHAWLFDGPVGLLLPGGHVTPLHDTASSTPSDDRAPHAKPPSAGGPAD